jgi:pyrrolidone-carboxylate peptidase
VSCEDCDIALDTIYAKVQKNLQRSNGTRHIVLNFGVAAGRKDFTLECRGKNIKDFRCPDERGNVFKNLPIEGSDTT